MRIYAAERILNKFHYELECIVRMFEPDVTVEFLPLQADAGQQDDFWIEITQDYQTTVVTVGYGTFCESRTEPTSFSAKEEELSVCRSVFSLLSAATGRGFEWGVLTGVRPVKLVRMLREKGQTYEEIARVFSEEYLAAAAKTELCIETDRRQAPLLAKLRPNDYSLYLSIPFCPSRCNYCSFVSHSIEKVAKLIPDYLDALCREARLMARKIEKSNLALRTVYIGGGTPTVLDADQLRRLFDTLAADYPMNRIREFTVEAGRPDTITVEKLQVLHAAGVNRVSINPQTLDDNILRLIGRNHTAAQFLSAFEAAKAMNFTAINVDLIAGLSNQTPDSFTRTLEQIIALAPENITVHTLTRKRASALGSDNTILLREDRVVREMVDTARAMLSAAGYNPYYLYRQKGTIGGLENVGYSKPGHEGLYNIYIMDDTHTILSLGSGGVTKLVTADGKVKRSFNYKYPYEYINRFDELMQRKSVLDSLQF